MNVNVGLIYRNSVSISVSNDYANTVIEKKRLLRPFPAVLFCFTIKAQFHVQISKIMGHAWFIEVD